MKKITKILKHLSIICSLFLVIGCDSQDPEPQVLEGVKYDLAVPPDRIAAFLRTASDAVEHISPGSLPYAFGHVGDGNLHFTVLRPGDDATLEADAGARGAPWHPPLVNTADPL